MIMIHIRIASCRTFATKGLCFMIVLCAVFASCAGSRYRKMYEKHTLTVEDCKNIYFIKWLFEKETGLTIKNDIAVSQKDYSGGIPVKISQFPIIYTVPVNKNEYANYKKQILKRNNNDWFINDIENKIIYYKITKFELSCTITEKELVFGFSNIDIIRP